MLSDTSQGLDETNWFLVSKWNTTKTKDGRQNDFFYSCHDWNIHVKNHLFLSWIRIHLFLKGSFLKTPQRSSCCVAFLTGLYNKYVSRRSNSCTRYYCYPKCLSLNCFVIYRIVQYITIRRLIYLPLSSLTSQI